MLGCCSREVSCCPAIGSFLLPTHLPLCLPCAHLPGLTVLLDESAKLAWASDLQQFFAASSDAGSSGGPFAGPGIVGALPPAPAPALDWAVCLLSTGVRYEPQDTSLAAAVLTAASITWQARHGELQSAAEARRLALHVAAAAGGRGSSPERAQRGGVAATAADVAGFHQVAAEQGVCVQLPTVSPQQLQQQQQGRQQVVQQPTVREVVITNRGLSITLSRHTLLVLQRLARQLPGRNSSGDSSGGPLGAAVGCCSPGPEWSVGSCASMGSTSSGQVGVNVMQGVVQSAYASPRRPAEHPLEASVFLDGRQPMPAPP